jgi:hypothetical protein
MQLSAANLLIASQQFAHGGTKVAPDAKVQFSAALAPEKGVEGAGFEPLDFKQAPRAATPAAPATSYGGSARIGANIDIRV